MKIELVTKRQNPNLREDAELMTGKVGRRTNGELERINLELERFKAGAVETFDINSFVKSQFKGLNHPDYDARRWAGQTFENVNLNGVDLLFESPYGFILRKNAVPLAVSSFEVTEDSPGILVRQLQGIEGAVKELQPLKWSKLLLSQIISFADRNDIPEVFVLPYSRNTYRFMRRDRFFIKGERDNGFLIYDVTARRGGFEYDEGRQVYVRKNPVIESKNL